MRKASVIFLASLALLVSQCDTSSEGTKFATASGVEVKVLSEGNEFLVDGNLLKIQATCYTGSGGEILKTNTERPLLMMYTKGATNGGLIQEVLEQLKVGDSVEFEIPAGDLYSNTFEISLPDSLSSEQAVAFTMYIEDQLTLQEYRAEMQQQEFEKYSAEFEEEQKNLDAYISENDIETNRTGSGLHYLILQEGAGEKISAGDSLTVSYHGYLLDGTSFGEGSFSFVAGQGQVIAGWDEGVSYLSQGSKAKFFVPSKLGYGNRGTGEIIPPFATLIFDVEVLGVKKKTSI
jgi:FKBP-type peptidyl-prolyl cis-trans isomerase